MNRVIQVHTPLGPGLRFRSLLGEERLSQLFEFEVEMLCPTHSLDMTSLLGKSVTVEVLTATGLPRYLDGQVMRCTLVGRDVESTRNQYLYRATLRPWFWLLTQTNDNRIFQNKSVPEVIEEVLAEYGFPFEMRLEPGDYRPWEYCVQYQESDFDFLSRLMEHEGIYYWFQHELGRHTLVLADGMTQHDVCPGYDSVPFYQRDGLTAPRAEYIDHWEVSEQMTPGAYATVDYDFKKPAAKMDGMAANPNRHDHAALEIHDWLGGYTELDQAERYAQVRLEGLQAAREQVQGSSNVRGLAPGYTFTLRNHPRMVENRQYLAVAVRYELREGGYTTGFDEGTYRLSFVVQPAQLPFRAPRTTRIPHTHGPQTARVVGPAGEQIWTDKYGRVKVQFHWDRYGKADQNSSCWVRVSSPWAGGGFGGIQLPRINDEVVVDFIGGNPDRPLIIGRVYNDNNMPPWELPANATQSGFLTRSKDGTPENANALRFEDKPGSEEIWLHAERDLLTEVENDERRHVYGNRTTEVTKNDHTYVLEGNRVNEVRTGTDTLYVKGTRDVTIDDKTTEYFNNGLETNVINGELRTVTEGFEETIKTGDHTTTVTEGDVVRTIVAGNLTETVNQQISVESETAGIHLQAKQKVGVISTDNTLDAIAQQAVTVESQASTLKALAKDNMELHTQAAFAATAQDNMTILTPKNIDITGAVVTVTSTAKNKYYAPASFTFTPARALIGVATLQAWHTNVGLNRNKIDVTALKLDMFGMQVKAAMMELKNSGLKSGTYGFNGGLSGLWIKF